MHLVGGLFLFVLGKNLQYVESVAVPDILQMCRSYECCKVANFQACICSSAFKCGSLKMCREENCSQMLQSLQGLQSFQCCGVIMRWP